MTPLAIGALLAAGAMLWVIAPVFHEEGDLDVERRRPPAPPDAATDAAAEAAIRRWREPK